jgi:hypothetical protein
MTRTIAELPKRTRITDYISLGVLIKTCPLRQVKAVLAAQGKTSLRQREASARFLHIMRGSAATFAATQTRYPGSHEPGESQNAVLPEAGIPFHAPTSYSRSNSNLNIHLAPRRSRPPAFEPSEPPTVESPGRGCEPSPAPRPASRRARSPRPFQSPGAWRPRRPSGWANLLLTL